MRRGYVNIGDQDTPLRLHFRMAGKGPAVVLLHPSPMSSAAMTPVMQAFAPHATAIALDTPGYGYSDPLTTDSGDLSAYVDALDKFREKLGIQTMGLYGSATGAQIAIEYAKAYKNRCSFAVLDNAADFEDSIREHVTKGYFPDFSTQVTGSHLAAVWGLALDQLRFFPWHHHTAEARLPTTVIDPNIVQGMALQFLQAGADYDKAYRAAFHNEKAERLLSVEVPTVIVRWAGSILKPYTDRFDQHDWPDNIRMLPLAADMASRMDGLSSIVREYREGLPDAPDFVEEERSCGGPRFAALPCGSVHELCMPGSGVPWVLLHDLGSSLDAIRPMIEAFGQRRPVLAPDLPGHGATDFRLDADLDYVTGAGGIIQGLIKDAGMTKINLLAIGESAAIGLEVARQLGSRVNRLVFLNPTREPQALDVTPELDGTHLLRLWHHLKNRLLYVDETTFDKQLKGEPDIDPGVINQRIMDLMRSRPAYLAAKVSSDKYPLEKNAKEFRERILLARTVNSTSGDRSRHLFSTALSEHTVDLSSDMRTWPESLN